MFTHPCSAIYSTALKKQSPGESSIKILIQAYRAYLKYAGNTETLTLTRAWILRRFVNSGMLDYTPFCKCGGKFITHAGEPVHGYQCVMCHPPSRAVKKNHSGITGRRHKKNAHLSV